MRLAQTTLTHFPGFWYGQHAPEARPITASRCVASSGVRLPCASLRRRAVGTGCTNDSNVSSTTARARSSPLSPVPWSSPLSPVPWSCPVRPFSDRQGPIGCAAPCRGFPGAKGIRGFVILQGINRKEHAPGPVDPSPLPGGPPAARHRSWLPERRPSLPAAHSKPLRRNGRLGGGT